jgi:hypothetical protein
MMPPLDLSPEALRFISVTGPTLPAEVLEALALPGERGLYGVGRNPGPDGGERAFSVRPPGSGEAEVEDDLVQEFVEGAARGLDEVLRAPGAGRDLAFRLLAADALLTWACEAAADTREPERMLRNVVSALRRSTP